jgi:hypothetical protein
LRLEEGIMKDGLRFVDCDMHIMRTVSRETAAKILLGGAGLYGFTEAHFAKAAAAAAKRAPTAVAAGG